MTLLEAIKCKKDKVTYATKHEAKKAKKLHGNKGLYFCKDCNGYHLTNLDRSQRDYIFKVKKKYG